MSLLENFAAWRKRRRYDRLKRWARTRTRGRTRFIIRVWIIWSGAEILGSLIFDYFAEGRIDLRLIFMFAIGGPILGLILWWSNEGEYTAAKLDARMKGQDTFGSNGET